jgi:hypothetical protein
VGQDYLPNSQRRFAEQCPWEKALPKLKDPDRSPDPTTVQRWASGLDCSQLLVSFISQTVILCISLDFTDLPFFKP